MSKSHSFAHIVCTAEVPPGHELAKAQPVTFATMTRARDVAIKAGLAVDLFETHLENERPAVPADLQPLKTLERSVLDVGQFAKPRRLPLIGDIIRRLYDDSHADYFIYTNVDIALRPHFYLALNALAARGHDAFIIDRRTIFAPPERASDVAWLLRQKGSPHGGHDCFVFRRELLENVDFLDLCIGMPAFSPTFAAVLSCATSRFRVFKHRRLTFHVNDERTWSAAEYGDYRRHNLEQSVKILLEQWLCSPRFPRRAQGALEACRRDLKALRDA